MVQIGCVNERVDCLAYFQVALYFDDGPTIETTASIRSNAGLGNGER
jgi:hypothetical protein